MSLWSKVLFAVAAALLVVAIGLAIERLMFVSRALPTVGHVVDVSARNASCGRRRMHRPCTKFRVVVEYRIENGAPRRLKLSAGSARGHDQPLSAAHHPPGSAVRLIYDPRNTQRIYRDAAPDVFAGPLFSVFLSLVAGAGGLTKRRN